MKLQSPLMLLSLAFVLAGLGAAPLHAERVAVPQPSPSLETVVPGISFSRTPLETVVEKLNLFLGSPDMIRIDPALDTSGMLVTVSLKNLSIRHVLEILAAQLGLVVDETASGVILRADPGAVAQPEVKEVAAYDAFDAGRASAPRHSFGLMATGSAGFAPEPAPFDREAYAAIDENRFLSPWAEPLSTFSIDVDGASYSNVRDLLMRTGKAEPDAVRIEEFVNYFPYEYPAPDPEAKEPFRVSVAAANAPWNPANRLVRIGIKAREIPWEERPQSNLVFLLDTSGSMNQPNKLPLVKDSLRLLVDQLDADDRVAIVVYAGSAGLVLPSTTANNRETINHAMDQLRAGGSTNGGEGIELAYKVAQEHFVDGGTNRVILCTDGDFNVGKTSEGALVRLIEEKAASGVQLTVLGFGRGNYQDDRMESLSNKGNGNYAFIDGVNEARRVFLHQLTGTLLTVASDVKIQVEFNPAKVAKYRLVGYENRLLETEDFDDDTVDAGEIGAGHTVTALYEIVPAGAEDETGEASDLRYQKRKPAGTTGELLNVALRYKLPGEDASTRFDHPFVDAGATIEDSDSDFRFASAVAAFAQNLRDSEHKGEISYQEIRKLAQGALGVDPGGYRAEFLTVLAKAEAAVAQRSEDADVLTGQ